jgi:hypothetical protein
MKTLLNTKSSKFIRLSDERANHLVHGVEGDTFRFMPKWCWKEQEGIEYKGKK